MFDVILLILLAIGTYMGFRRGLINTVIDIVGVIFGFILAIIFFKSLGNLLSSFISIPEGFVQIISFALIVIVVHFLWGAIKSFILPLIPSFLTKNIFNRIGGLIIGFFYTLLYLSFLAWVFLRYPVPQLQSQIQESTLLPKFNSLISRSVEKISQPIDVLVKDLATIQVSPAVIGETSKMNVPFSQLEVKPEKERELIEKANIERRKQGLTTLVYSQELTSVAREHAKDMWQRQFFAHNNPDGETPFDRINEANIPYISAGENLALAPTVESAHEGLMNSPGHRANILHSDFGRIGIGAIDGGPVAGIIFVQLFSN